MQQVIQYQRSVSWLQNRKREKDINNQPLVRILVVDDFADWQHFVIAKLRGNPSFQVIGVASDGLEAVLKTEELQPDLILLDIGLPRLNGIEAARRVRKAAPVSKILFLSQELDADVVEAALSAGGYGYVLKSDADSELFAAIEAVVSGNKFVSRSFNGQRWMWRFALKNSPTKSPEHRTSKFCADIYWKGFAARKPLTPFDESVRNTPPSILVNPRKSTSRSFRHP